MTQKSTRPTSEGISRRNFLQTATVATAASLVAINGKTPRVYAAGSDKIRVGLIGCGGRGNGAARDCMASSEGVELYALGDLFKDYVDTTYKRLKEGTTNPSNNQTTQGLGAKFNVTPERCFSGFDAYKKVIDSGVDLVILATSPHYRPIHFRAAIEAGKNVFTEKPVAVDPQGVKSVIATSELASQKGLGVVAGTQRRHQTTYLEIMKRIQNGDIGDVVSAEAYWLSGCPWWDKGPELWQKKQELGWTEAEYQNRNWFHYTWLSGDIIVEQHVHNLDVINWAVGALPVKAIGTGGRAVRIGDWRGDIWDHFSISYEYPNGVHVASMCRQHEKCTDQVSERIVGTKGVAYFYGSNSRIEGKKAYTFDKEANNPMVQEHADLIKSIRDGKPLNEGKRIAESTLTAILGRMCAYTGRAVNYDWALNASKLDYTPSNYAFGDLPVPKTAIPGITQLI